MFGVEPDGLAVVGQRLVVLALSGPGVAPVGVRQGRFGVKADGLGIVGQRLVVLALGEPGVAPIDVPCDLIARNERVGHVIEIKCKINALLIK